MEFISLASSSKGNLYIVQNGNEKLLIECGVPYKKIQQLLNYDFTGIKGCLITHEHKDHAKSVKNILAAGIPIYTAEETAKVLNIIAQECIPEQEFSIGNFRIIPFPIFHDAVMPLGFFIKHGNDKLVFATDTFNIPYIFPKANIIAVECNYLSELLSRSEHLPDKVRKRISRSHFELEAVIRWLYKQDLSVCREIHLMHLSDACSDEGTIMARMCAEFGPNIDIAICRKEQYGK